MKELYCDSNAHLPLNVKALQTYTDFVISKAGHGHPSSLSEPGRLAATALEDARTKIAELIGAKTSNQIIFTSSCTQACQWATKIFFNINLDKYHTEENPMTVSTVEHPAMRDAFEKYDTHHYPNHLATKMRVDKNGVLQAFTAESREDFCVDKITCVYVQNETGVIQPIDQLKDLLFSNASKKICSDIDKKKYILSDMSQALGKMQVNVTRLNVDAAVFGAHKFGGPGGIGFIYLKNTDWWQPFATGSRYYMDRPGTPDVAGVVATAAALQNAIETLSTRQENMKIFQSVLETKLKNMGLKIIGDQASRVANTSYIAGLKKARFTLMELSGMGIHAGLGSACGSYSTNISPLMHAMGYTYELDHVMRISQWGDYGAREAEFLADQIWKIDQR